MVAIPIFDVMEVAIDTLIEIRSEKSLNVLTKAMQHENLLIRLKASTALLNSNVDAVSEEKATDILIGLIYELAAPGSAMRREPQQALMGCLKPLIRSGNKKATEAVALLLQNQNLSIRLKAAIALSEINNDKALEVLTAVLQVENNYRDYFENNHDDYLWNEAVDSLEKINNERTVDFLVTILNGNSDYSKRLAAEALGRVGSEKTIDALISALNDEDSTVRGKAAEALRQIGSDKVIDALITALNHEGRDVREKAAAALGQIGSAVCLEKLLQSVVPDLMERPEGFSLARSWAIRFSKAKLPFIPVYPELLPTPAMTDKAEA